MKLLVAVYFLISSIYANPGLQFTQTKTQYTLDFNSCPMKSAGDLAILLAREFDQSKSLYKLKRKFIDERYKEIYFLSNYSISYNPIAKKLSFKFECPALIARIQITKENGVNFLGSLVDTGEVFDPQYEVLLKREKLISSTVPYFAISIKNLNEQKHLSVVKLLKQMNPKIYQQVSEVILNESEELTLILKSKSKATSVLLGKEYWDDKISKLLKIQEHFSQKEKTPLVINLTSNKKVVVRF
jgi:uncharacterized protein YqkB